MPVMPVMPAASPLRPGVRFVAHTPPGDDLPRMDVAAFVGFAASGPLHVPVAVEGAPEFAAVFGRDLVLGAGDDGPIVAQLAPAVRAFFAGGGRRCWVVRVAFTRDWPAPSGPAAVVRFPLPGVVALAAGGEVAADTVTVEARAAGSWADDVRLTASLECEALATSADALVIGDVRTDWRGISGPHTLARGDLLRVTTREPDAEGWWFVDEAREDRWRPAPSPLWTRAPAPNEAAPAVTHARITDASFALLAGPGGARLAFHGGQAVVWADHAAVAGLRPGALVELTGAGQWWLVLAETTPTAWRLVGAAVDVDDEALDHPAVRGAATVRWLDPAAPDRPVIAPLARWTAVDGDLAAWTVDDDRVAAVPTGAVLQLHDNLGARLGFLRVQGVHPAAWALRGDVRGACDPPDSSALARARVERVTLALRTVDGAGEARVGGLGFAGEHRRPWARLPADERLFAAAADDELARDVRSPRLAVAGPVDAPARTLPIGLTFARDAAAWVPEATPFEREGLSLGDRSLRETSADPFLDPRLVALPAGDLLDAVDRLEDLARHAGGPPVRGLHAVLTIPEVTLLALPDAAWVGRTFLRRSSEASPVPLPAPPPAGDGGFRECAASTPPPPALPLPPRIDDWRLAAPAPGDDPPTTATRDLQRQAIRLCAVRGDLTVALSAPPELRARGLVRHLAGLRAPTGLDLAGPTWARALSFASLHHPWLVVRDGSASAPLATSAPDGAVLGGIARGAFARRPTVVPTALRDVLALTPALTAAEVAELHAARVCVIVREARGVVPIDARTLSDDPDWTELSVRRLMILLRRAALLRGERFVFEPLGGALRRGVALGFEALLARLYDRGAFAGATAAEAFQVVVGDTAAEEGRLVVELRVAPAQPLRFLTVRLVQRGGALGVEEGAS